MPNPIFKSAPLALSATLAATVLAGCMAPQEMPTKNEVISTSNSTFAVTNVAYAPQGGGQAMSVYLTGYSFWDNTPRGSAQIARPVIHRQAGGSGTYHDPVTIAVGHSKVGGRSYMDFPAGTRFYFPKLQKYGIVEDLCGDGPNPQNGPCHSGHRGLPWLDIYVGGRSISASSANSCMYAITGVQKAILNPGPGMPVLQGEVALSNCRV